MGYKLTVSDVLEVPVKLSLKDGGKDVQHAFRLQAKRMDQRVLRDTLQTGDRLTRDVLHEQIIGWSGQRLVLDEDGQPAAFCAEAFDCLLSLAGMETIALNAYLAAVVLADTSAGRAKN